MTPVDALTCAALAATWPWNPAMGDPSLSEEACVIADFDVAGRLDATFPDPGIQTQARLQRSRVELGVASRHNVLARIAVDGRQSAPDTGYLGLEGESLYVRVQIAEARYVVPRLGLSVAGGLIDDPWVISANQAWGYRPLDASFTEREGWHDRSDLGAALTWTAPHRTARITASLLAGEGLQRRERNNGKSAHLTAELRLLALSNPDLADVLVLTAYGREGSRGPMSTRDHRLAFRVHGVRDGVGYGAAVTRAWGVLGDGDRVPLGGELWGSADVGVLTSAAKVEVIDERPGVEETTDVRVLAAAGVRPRRDGDRARAAAGPPNRPAHVMVGVVHDRAGAASAAVAGGDGTRRSTMVFVQVGVNLVVQGPVGLGGRE